MKVILTTNIKKLGKIGDLVFVKDGFARNFLFPNNMALRNTKSNQEHYEKIKDEIILKENTKKQKSEDLIAAVKKININFIKEADEREHLYGAVSKKEIINYFSEKGIHLQSDDIKIIQDGLKIPDFGIVRAEISLLEIKDKDHFIWDVVLNEGKNREIKRIFSTFGSKVESLHRISFAGIELGGLKPGISKKLSIKKFQSKLLAEN